MRALGLTLLSALLVTQVYSAVSPLTQLRRNGASLSWVLEIEIPDYIFEKGREPLDPPIFVDAVVEADFDDATEETRLSTARDESISFLKNKMLWDVEERTLGISVEPGNEQSGTVQTSESSALETRSEHAVTQAQLQATADIGAGTLPETKHNGDVQKRIESIDVQTESRRSDDVQGSDEAMAQTDSERTATQKEVPSLGDSGNNTERKQLDVVQQRFGSDIVTERRQNADTPRSEVAVAEKETESKATQKQVQAVTDRISASQESHLSEAAQNRTEGPDGKIQNRLGDEAKEEAVAPLVSDKGSGTNPMETASARGMHHDLDDDNGTETSGNNSRREATDSTKGNATSQVSDRSTITEIVRHIVLEQPQMPLGGSEASETKPVHEVLLERAKDLQEENEVANGSKSNGPQNEKVLEARQMTGRGVEESTIKQAHDVLSERAKDLKEESEVTHGSKSNGPEQEKVLETRQMTGRGVEEPTTKQAHDVLSERARDLQEESNVTHGSKSNGPEQEKILETRQMTGRGVEESTTKQTHDVLSERAKDLQEESEVTHGSKSNGPEQEKVLETRQMTGRGVEEPTTKQAHDVLSERARDLQEESDVTNRSKSIGAEREKENSIRSEATVRRSNEESNDVTKDDLETSQLTAKFTATVLQKEEVQRHAMTTTQASQMEITGASRNAAGVNGVNFTEESTSGRGPNTSMSERSLVSLDANKTDVDSSEENPAKVTLTIMDERRELLRSDAVPERRKEYVPKTIRTRSHSTLPYVGVYDEGSAWEKDRYTGDT